MTPTKGLASLELAALLPAAAAAQGMSGRFRPAAAPNNMSGCIAADPEADMLSVTERNLGCKWIGKKE